MMERVLFRMRSYQLASREARARNIRRFVRLWHRRAGKDRDAMSFMLDEMIKRQGVYFDIFPSLNQGRRDIWNNIFKEKINNVEHSVTIRDMFPPELVRRWDNSEMLCELINGSIFQVMGADSDESVDRLRGPNPVFLHFSEYAHGTKMEKAWNTLSPVLAENGGMAMWSYTPNGINHGHQLWESALANPRWFTQKLTIEDTYRDAEGEDGSRIVSLEEIEDLRAQGIREEFIQQEFYCSFTGFLHGSIYGDLVIKVKAEDRLADFPYIANAPVGVCMDLGHSDAMAAWFYQVINGGIRFINYWEDTRKDIKDAAKLFRELPYLYGRIILPWDGRSAANYLEEVGFTNVHVCDRPASLQAELEQVRREFGRFFFDRRAVQKTQATGISGWQALENYKRKFDEDLRVFAKQPIHDAYSHGADALRTGVAGGFEPLYFSQGSIGELKVETEFDPRDSYIPMRR